MTGKDSNSRIKMNVTSNIYLLVFSEDSGDEVGESLVSSSLHSKQPRSQRLSRSWGREDERRWERGCTVRNEDSS